MCKSMPAACLSIPTPFVSAFSILLHYSCASSAAFDSPLKPCYAVLRAWGPQRLSSHSSGYERRLYYALQTVIPPIILVLVAFSSFLVAKEKFVDCLKALVGLMFPLYIFQFSLSATLPQTYTMLAPNYLVFVSIILLLLLIIVAAVSYIIMSRQEHFKW